ncbi:hypothetical protein O181_058440 [Austropuccinia psidii MF-1]|uniref:C3H1-type domain-containing protein n=1 Tax=Austropuccinia psidii MF-1 TaxID=1389203 RepID=A0A9Q3HXV5_9BASI|nr:hypothetical protein [Austropuccinia psidii MF-1]
MPLTKLMMLMTNSNSTKPNGDLTSHQSDFTHNSESLSSRSSVCSSNELCTPTPLGMNRSHDPKRLSMLSSSSLQSDLSSQMAPSVNSTDSSQIPQANKFLTPSTPPLLNSSPPTQQTENSNLGFLNQTFDSSNIQITMTPWSSIDSLGQQNQNKSNQIDQLNPSNLSENTAAYEAFHSWSPQPSSQHSIDEYRHRTSASPNGHSRSASYQSTQSSSIDSTLDSSTASAQTPILDVNYSSVGLANTLAQMSLNPLMSDSLSGMSMYSPALSGRYTPNTCIGNQHQVSSNLRQQDHLNFADPLTNLCAAYAASSAYTGYPQQYIDPQTLLAYSNALASTPSNLLELYGLKPELLATGTDALARLVNGTDLDSLDKIKEPKSQGPSPANKKTNLYKTELCRSWEEKGSCRYGSRCQFAHGQDELRSVNRHPKFKTEICRTFWLHGSCPYGKRCCFLHTTATDGSPTSNMTTNLDGKQTTTSNSNAHDPPTSRLQQRTSSSPESSGSVERNLGLSLSAYLASSPQLHSAPPVRPHSEIGHCRNTSSGNSSPLSSFDGLRIQIGSRLSARDQVPAQEAPGPRSRLERLRPTSDYIDSAGSMPTTSVASSTRYNPFLDSLQPPHSAFSDFSSILRRSPCPQPIGKALSANGDESSNVHVLAKFSNNLSMA